MSDVASTTVAETPAATPASSTKPSFDAILAEFEQQQTAGERTQEGGDPTRQPKTELPPVDSDDDAATVEAEAEAEPEATEDTGPGSELTDEQIKEIRDLVAKGDHVGALKAAGAKQPEKVAAKHWADIREYKKRAKAEMDAERAKVSEDRSAVAAEAKRLEERFGPLSKAREAYEMGKLGEAIQLAFGETDVDGFAAKVVKLKTARDPETYARMLAMEKREQERKTAEQREETQRKEQAEQAAYAKRVEAYHEKLQGDLKEEFGDSALSAMKEAGLTDLVLRSVTSVQLKEYRETEEELPAKQALQRIADTHRGWTKVLTAMQLLDDSPDQGRQNPENPDQDGSPPARQRPRAASHQRARRAGGKPQESADQLLERTARELESSLGRF